MKRKARSRFQMAGLAAVLFILFIGFIALVATFPQYFSTLGISISSYLYQKTGGLVGKPPPLPPVELEVGQQMLNRNNSIVIMWNNTEPAYTGPEVYFGNDSGFVTVYALNITNNQDIPVVKIAIYYPAPTNYPPIKPWYTNSSFVQNSWGPVTNWAFANVMIKPHRSVIIYNVTALSMVNPITFYFSNGSAYTIKPTYVPSASG